VTLVLAAAVYGAHFLGHPEQVRQQVQRVGAEVYGDAASGLRCPLHATPGLGTNALPPALTICP
jgi:hypothetical protein